MDRVVLWYTTRASGAVSMVLLSAVVVLGLLARMRVEGRGWPRFLSAELHRNLALLTLVFLGLHIVTAVTDPFTSLGIAAATVPFSSTYRTVWLGLGTISFELLLAVITSSLLRHVIGHRLWRAVHWAAYGCWPLAVAHGVGTGTDSFSLWLAAITAASCIAVAAAAIWRFAGAPVDPLAGAKRAHSG